VERAVAGALPYLRNPAGRKVGLVSAANLGHQVVLMLSKDSKGSNLRLALILASVAAVFFAGIVAKYALFQ
jgi:hypothetical protein